jgi:hypothetical protein
LEGIEQYDSWPSVVVSDLARQSDLAIALARQQREGLFEGGGRQLPVLGPVAVGPLSASNSELRVTGGSVSVGRFVRIRQAFATSLRRKEIPKLLEGIVQSRNPAVSILVPDGGRQKVVAGHGPPGSAHRRLLMFRELTKNHDISLRGALQYTFWCFRVALIAVR